jgi:oligopeptide transport system substrate-binding protein
MKRTFRNASALALSFCMVATLLTGCGSSTTTTASSTDTASKKTITIAESDNAIALDPTLAEDSFSCVIVGNTIEGLYSVTPEGKVELAMAKDVKVSDDGLTWTFTIRDDAKWSNGDPVTADDFVFGIQRIADPAANTGFAFEVESAHIKNAADVTSGKKTLDQLGVTAKDDKTLVIELDTPCAYLDALLSFSAFAPTNRAFFEKEGSNFALTAKDLLYNGPYVVTSFDTGSNTVTLDKNPNYYDAANVDIDELNFQVLTMASFIAIIRYALLETFFCISILAKTHSPADGRALQNGGSSAFQNDDRHHRHVRVRRDHPAVVRRLRRGEHHPHPFSGLRPLRPQNMG